MIKLGRIQVLLAGIVLIALACFANRLSHLVGTEKLPGHFVFYVEEDSPEGKNVFPIIEYRIKDSVYQFRAREGSSYVPGEEVGVLIKNGDHDNPVLYTPGSFWAYPLFYFLLPVVIWIAFSISYVTRNEHVEVKFGPPFFAKKRSRMETGPEIDTKKLS
jgi:hypothetical protein